MISAHAADSIIVDGITYGVSGGASSAIEINADIGAGVFSGWGNVQVSGADGYIFGMGSAQFFMGFTSTTAYEYTLDVTISPGSWSIQFQDGFSYAWDSNPDLHGQSLHLSGTLFSDSYTFLQANYHTNTQRSQPSGSFQYTLTLTPVPVPEPETWGLMLSGLGLVGWAARRRKHAAV
jgi:hypothetical protein